MLIVNTIVGFCNCSMFCCELIYFHSSLAIILMDKRALVALLCLSSWCLVIVVWLFLTMPQVCLQFVIVEYSDNTHSLFMVNSSGLKWDNDSTSKFFSNITMSSLLTPLMYHIFYPLSTVF